MSDKLELEKDKRIKTEVSRLNSLLKNLDAKKKKAVSSLIKNAAFMAVTLEDLQEEINRNGVTETYQNGANQSGVKKSSAVEVYNTMIKNHVQVMKQLTELMPKDVPKVEDDGFDTFVNSK
jgi:predicted transcriptional regulator